MQSDKTIQLFQSLPQEMQQAVRQYVEFLANKVGIGKEPEEDETQPKPTIRWAKNPDPAALQGLSGDEPLSLSDIRRKAWKR